MRRAGWTLALAVGVAWLAAAQDQARLTVRACGGASHLFQRAVTGAPAEYATIETAFVPEFAVDLAT